MKKLLLLISAVFIMIAGICAQKNITVEKDTAYIKVVTERAAKIVAKINIHEGVNAIAVRDIIAMQYVNMNDIYNRRDAALLAAKNEAGNEKPLAEIIKKTDESTTASLDSLHAIYITQLSTLLDSAQVSQVKDGMTYDVLHVTYNGYLQMIPRLTDVQKKQIWDWLIEAREHAMDAESSEKKHAWFGKYKGRINNYLSKEGYDVKKEGEEWQKRIKAQKNAK